MSVIVIDEYDHKPEPKQEHIPHFLTGDLIARLRDRLEREAAAREQTFEAEDLTDRGRFGWM